MSSESVVLSVTKKLSKGATEKRPSSEKMSTSFEARNSTPRTACPFCPKSYSKSQDLILHVTRLHRKEALDSNWIRCSVDGCWSVFSSQQSAAQHAGKKHRSTESLDGSLTNHGTDPAASPALGSAEQESKSSGKSPPLRMKFNLSTYTVKLIDCEPDGHPEATVETNPASTAENSGESEEFPSVASNHESDDGSDSNGQGTNDSDVDLVLEVNCDEIDSEADNDDDAQDTIEENIKILNEEMSKVRQTIQRKTKETLSADQTRLADLETGIRQQRQLLQQLYQQQQELQKQLEHLKSRNEQEHQHAQQAKLEVAEATSTLSSTGSSNNGQEVAQKGSKKRILLEFGFRKEMTSPKRKQVFLEPRFKRQRLDVPTVAVEPLDIARQNVGAGEKRIVLQPTFLRKDRFGIRRQNGRLDKSAQTIKEVRRWIRNGELKNVQVEQRDGTLVIKCEVPMELTQRPDFFPKRGRYRCQFCSCFIAESNVQFVDHVKRFHRNDVDEEVLGIMERQVRAQMFSQLLARRR